MGVLVTCKNKEDPIKNIDTRLFTTLYINFSDAQGQITLKLVLVSGRSLNSSKISCMSSLPARMRMIESKMKELECSQDFSHYKSMGIFPDDEGQLTPQQLVRSGRNSNSVLTIWLSLLPERMKIKTGGARVFTRFSYLLPLKPKFSSDVNQKLMQPFPYPNDPSVKI